MWPSAEGAGGVAVGGGRSGGDEEATGEVEETRKIFLCRAHGRWKKVAIIYTVDICRDGW